MRNFLHFLQYHNAVPIALGIVILGGGATFAATNPQAIYRQTQTPVSVDNTYIANKDLSAYTSRVQIVAVTEDPDTYYVEYDFSTIDVQDYVWRDVTKRITLTVSKEALGEQNLAVYVTEQLNQNLDHESERLVESQIIARRNVSQKQVATAYGGLVGAFLDDTTETLPGYTPPAEPLVLPPPEGNVAVTAGNNSAVANTDSGLTREQVAQMIEQKVNELLTQQSAADTTTSPPALLDSAPSTDSGQTSSPQVESSPEAASTTPATDTTPPAQDSTSTPASTSP